jgi:hypothetical protein
VRQRAEAVGLGQFYPAFYSPASGMQHLDMSGLISQTSANVLDLEVAPSETNGDHASSLRRRELRRNQLNLRRRSRFKRYCRGP